jgi:hypothetical protein
MREPGVEYIKEAIGGRRSFQTAKWQGSIHPRTQGLFGKNPGIVWSRDSKKINCPKGEWQSVKLHASAENVKF